MKAIMYHYVRPERTDLPYHRYLHVDDFCRQLDWLEQTCGFVSREEFNRALATDTPVDGAVLTFDDGFSDHYDYVFPELQRRGLWGVFYVPTGIYQGMAMLDVHSIHVLIGRYGGVTVLEKLSDLIDNDMLVDKDNTAFRTQTYRFQDNDEATNEAKRILNYYISYEFRSGLLAQLMSEFRNDVRSEAEALYLTLDQIREMAAAGMEIGSHSVSHPVFSKLAVDRQWSEIDASFSFLEATLSQPIDTFCYPYGGFHNFTDDTKRLLTERGCRFAFNVEPRDIEARDLRECPMTLPRYDCNMLPHGKASMGASRPVDAAPLNAETTAAS